MIKPAAAPRQRAVRRLFILCGLAAAVAATIIYIRQEEKQGPGPWERKSLMDIPAYAYAPRYDAGGGVSALFYEGLPYRGRPTKIFAYVGIPEAMSPGEPAPAVVLVHGGAGTAYADWVREWNARGYAAIAMDLEGHLPEWDAKAKAYLPHEWSGPSNRAVWQDIDEPAEEQWTYHAVAAVVRAHSLLRSLPGVDPDRIGITGISWGGVLTGIVSGIDDRLRFAIPVYGSGFVHESESYFGTAYRSWSPETQSKFMSLWEPSTYLPKSRLPMLWVNGDNDGHFPLTVFTKSYRLVKERSTLSIHPGMPHGQEDGMRPPEIYAFADSVVAGGKPLSRIVRHDVDPDNGRVVVQVEAPAPIVKAELFYALNISDRLSPVWNRKLVELPDAAGLPIETELPEKAKTYYMNITDDRGFIVSTELTDVGGGSA